MSYCLKRCKPKVTLSFDKLRIFNTEELIGSNQIETQCLMIV